MLGGLMGTQSQAVRSSNALERAYQEAIDSC